MSDNYEQPVEPMSRVEDILRGDATVRPMSRVEELLKELIEAGGGGGGSTVVVTPIQQSGTKIANITVNGTGYDIFAPEGSSGSVVTIDPEYQSGTLLATLTIDSTDYYIYAPSGGGTTVVANPEGEATDTLEKIQIGNDIYSVESGGSGSESSGPNSEIIPLGPGDGTTTRTFNLQRTPKKVSIYWYEDWTGEYNQNWSSYYSFIWGQERAYGLGGGTDVEARNQIAKVASIAYGQDGKSFSLTGGDVGSSCNTDNAKHYGYLYLEYGSGSGSENIEDMTWTLLTSTTGIGTPIAIPSRTKRLVVLVKCDGKVQIVGNESLAAINKVLDITGESDYILGGYWTDQSNSNHGDNTCIISNGLVTAYSSYNTITTYVYALS